VSTPDQDDGSLSSRGAQPAVEFFVRKRMFSLYVSGREIVLDQSEFAIFLNLLGSRGKFIPSDWLSEAVYGVRDEGDASLRLRQATDRLRERLNLALGFNVILEDRRGYALSDGVLVRVRAL
jgi:DNA-binding response OmpR family regulator